MLTRRAQRLFKVFEDVVDVLYAHAEANRFGSDAGF
jgi:hypothetical protein